MRNVLKDAGRFTLTIALATLIGLAGKRNLNCQKSNKKINYPPKFEYVGDTWSGNSLPTFSDEDPNTLNAYVLWNNDLGPQKFQMGYLQLHQNVSGSKQFTLPEQYLRKENEVRIFAVDKQGLSSDTIPIYQCDFDGKWYEKSCEKRNKQDTKHSYFWGF